MICIERKEECCGCTACYNVCPVGCIKMTPDEEGFVYPAVDKKKCIGCEKCQAVCPMLAKEEVENKEIENKEIESYVLRTKNKDVLMNSTSGGFVTPLMKWVLEKNGIICAASYDEDYNVVHVFIDSDNEELDKIKGSKYVQSQLNDSFKKIKDYLKNGKFVCFIGTTCQVKGLKEYLGMEYEGLLSVDLVCHGTPSPKLWRKYLDYQTEKHQSQIKSISFRNKTYGYHSGTMKMEFENGNTYYGSARVDYMLKSFFKEISSRPSCYKCKFKQLERCSDFTIYDCWHASDLVKQLKDDDCGYTNLMVQSDVGRKVLEKVRDRYEIYKVDTEQAVSLDGIMVRKSAIPHPKRNEYYKDIDNEDLRSHIQKFIPVSKKDLLLERIKGFLYKTGLLRALKSIKTKLKK